MIKEFNRSSPENKLEEMQKDFTYYTERMNDINLILTEKWKSHMVVCDEGVIYRVQTVSIGAAGVILTCLREYAMDATPVEINAMYVEYVRSDD